MPRHLELDLLPDTLAVARLAPEAPTPAWAGGSFASVTRTSAELSVVCAEAAVPDGVTAERGFRCLRVRGPLAFAETGILQSLTRPLAEAGVTIFAISTFDTDFVLVPQVRLESAIAALEAAGHSVVGQDGPCR